VTRLEQALRDFRNSYIEGARGGTPGAVEGGKERLDPNLILGPDLSEVVRGRLSGLGITPMTEVKLRVKEYEAVGLVCCQSTSQTSADPREVL